MSETDPTIAARSARYRARKKGKRASCPTCPECGAKVLTPRPGGLCRRCWLKTPEGKEYQRLRIADFRQQARKRANLGSVPTES